MDAQELKEKLQREMEIPSGVDLVPSENSPNLLLFLENGKQVFAYSFCPDWGKDKIIHEAEYWLEIKVGASRRQEDSKPAKS